jgi:2-dehydro-3-deoxygalactonokinase
MSKFLSCDWGVSSFRLRLVETRTGEVSVETKSDMGIAHTWQQWLNTGRPEPERIHFYTDKLGEAIGQLPVRIDVDIPVILSGMASSSIGLAELPYQQFPFHWDLKQMFIRKIPGVEEFKHPMYLVSGFRTDDDVMRGEETMLFGFDLMDDDEKVIIFPGTHSKHVLVKQKTAIDFKTYMTGELFNLLAEKSILRTAISTGEDETSFADGFIESKEGNLLHKVFKIRSRQLLQHTDPVGNFQWLSGLLIGTELKDLSGTDYPVYLVCGEHLKNPYLQGLKLLDGNRKIVYLPDDLLLIKGHCKIAEYYF